MDLPPWIEKEAWEGFIKMRKSIKKPLTERAKVLAIHKLEGLLKQGHDPTAVLDQSTFNSWQGLFPVKEENKEGGDMKKRTAQEELLSELKNHNNKTMRSNFMSNESVKLFYSLNTHWAKLQQRVLAGEDIFKAPPKDQKMAAAGDV